MTTDRSRWGVILLIALPSLFLAYFFVYPVVSILLTGLSPRGTLTAAPILEVLTDRSMLGVAWFTLWQAAVSTVLTLILGLPGAYVFARFRFRGKAVIRALATVPFVLPTIVVGVAFLALLGPGGPLGIDLRRTVWAILIAHVFYNYALVIRGVGAAWEQIDPRLEDAARVLGASRWRAFREVTLPLLRPALAGVASLVFLFTFTSFGVILVLGGLRFATIEVEIWRQTTSFLNLEVAAALAILQLVGVGLILIVYSRYQERRAVEVPLRPTVETQRRPRSRGERILVAGNLALMGVLLGVPMAVLVLRSLGTPRGWSIDNYLRLGENPTGGVLFVAPSTAVANSLKFAVAATLIALVIGVAAALIVAYRRGKASRTLDTMLMLPLGVSAVTLGFGFLIALDQPVDLRASLLLIPIAHALVGIPFVVRTAVPVMRSVQARLREAAAVLGASPARAWREVDLPLVSRAVAVGAAFAFAVSLGEFGATSFIVRPESPTLPIAIFRLLGQPGAANFGRAMALSVLLMALTAGAVALIDRLRIGGGEF